MNYAVYYGIGQSEKAWRDDFFKMQIMRYLPKEWNMHLFSRIKKGEELLPDNVKFHYLYEAEDFDLDESEQEISEVEKWLGYPLPLILAHDRVVTTMHKDRDLKRQIAIASKYVKAWRKLFTENQIQIFSTSFESGICETTGWATAKRLGIPMVNFGLGRVFNAFVFMDDDFFPYYWKDLEEGEAEGLYTNCRAILEKRKEPEFKQIRDTVSRSTKFSLSKITNYIKFLLEYSKMKDYERTRYPRPTFAIPRYVKMHLRKILVKRLYREADYSKKFFFFPLQFAEEAQQMFREPFIDQYQLIKTISKVLPSDTLLYVKTHPHMQGIDISLNKLSEVARLPNVRIIHHDENPVKLTLNSVGLMTINSTTGFEAIVLGKPVIAFGHDWYAKEGIVTAIRDFFQLRDVIVDMTENPAKYVDEKKRKQFVSEYLKQFIPMDSVPKVFITMNEDEAKRVANELIALVKKLGFDKKGKE